METEQMTLRFNSDLTNQIIIRYPAFADSMIRKCRLQFVLNPLC